MGRYCLVVGNLAKAQVGELLRIHQLTHTTAVVNEEGKPVCVPHEGCTLELVSVAPALAQHPVLSGLQAGHTVHYEIKGTGHREKDVVTLKTGKNVDLKDLMGCTFQITEEKPA